MKARKNQRFTWAYAFLIATLVGLGFLLPVIARAMDDFSVAVRTRILSLVSEQTGFTVAYEGISPRLLGTMRLRGLELRRDDGSIFFRAESLDVGYDLWALLSPDRLKAVRSLRLGAWKLDLDLDRDLGARFQAEGPDQEPATFDLDLEGLWAGVTETFREDLRVIVSRGQARIYQPSLGWDAGITSAGISLTLESGGLLAEAAPLDVEILGLTEGPLGGTTSLSLNYDHGGRSLRGDLSIRGFESPWASTGALGLRVLLDSRSLVVQKIPDSLPFDLMVSLDRASGVLEARITAQDLVTERVVTLAPNLAALAAPWIQIPLDVDATARWDRRTPSLAWTARVGGRLVVEGLGPSEIRVSASGTQEKARLESLVASTGQGRVEVRGDADLLQPSFRGRAQGSVNFGERFGTLGFTAGIDLDPRRARATDLLVTALDTRVEVPEATLDLRTLAYRAQARWDDGAGGSLLAEAEGAIGAGKSHRVEVLLDQLHPLGDPSPLWKAFPALSLPALLSPDLDASGRLSLNFTSIDDYTLGISDLAVRNPGDLPLTLALDMDLSPSRFFWRRLDLVHPSVRWESEGAIVAEGSDWILESSHQVNGQSFSLGGRADQDLTTGEIQGDYGTFLSLSRDDLGVRGTWSVLEPPTDLLLPGLTAQARGDFEYRLADQYWRVGIQALEARGRGLVLSQDGSWATLVARGSLDASGLVLNDVRYVDALGSLDGWVGMTLGEAGLGLDLNLAGPLRQTRPPLPPLQERIEGSLVLAQGTVEGDLVLRGMRLGRLGVSGLTGGLGAEVRVQGALDDLEVSGRVQTENALYGRDPVTFRGDFRYRSPLVSLDNVSLALGDHRVLVSILELRTDTSSLDARVVYHGVGRPPEQGLVLELSLPLAPDEGEAIGFARLDNVTLGAKKRLAFTGQRLQDGWVWTETDELIRVGFSSDGNFLVRTTAPFPVVVTAQGSLGAGNLDVVVSYLAMDLAPFAAAMDLGFVKAEGGRLTGEFRMVGPLADPSLYGRLSVTDLQGRVELHPGALTARRVNLVLDDKEILVAPALVMADQTAVELEGSFTLTRFSLGSYSLLINVPQDRGLSVRKAYGPIDIDGNAAGVVTVRGGGGVIEVGARLSAWDTSLSMAPQAPEKPESDRADTVNLILNLDIRTLRNVEFLWPNRSIPILRGNLGRNQGVLVRIDTGAGTSLIRGNVALQGGEVYYLDRSFFIKEARLIMDEADGAFNPILEARAEGKAAVGPTLHTLLLTIDQDRLQSLQPRISADPFLPQEAIELVMAGGNPSDPGSLDLSTVIYTGVDAVSRFGIFRDLEAGARNLLGVDVFSLRSGLFPSLVQDAVVTTPLDNQTYSFGKYLDKTSLLVGKVFGQDLYGEILAQLEADDSLESSNGLGLEFALEVNMEWNTPFFDINWAFRPKDPDTLFLKDHKFTFTWDLR